MGISEKRIPGRGKFKFKCSVQGAWLYGVQRGWNLSSRAQGPDHTGL